MTRMRPLPRFGNSVRLYVSPPFGLIRDHLAGLFMSNDAHDDTHQQFSQPRHRHGPTRYLQSTAALQRMSASWS